MSKAMVVFGSQKLSVRLATGELYKADKIFFHYTFAHMQAIHLDLESCEKSGAGVTLPVTFSVERGTYGPSV